MCTEHSWTVQTLCPSNILVWLKVGRSSEPPRARSSSSVGRLEPPCHGVSRLRVMTRCATCGRPVRLVGLSFLIAPTYVPIWRSIWIFYPWRMWTFIAVCITISPSRTVYIQSVIISGGVRTFEAFRFISSLLSSLITHHLSFCPSPLKRQCV